MKSRLHYAFTGDAAGLRDELIKHFKECQRKLVYDDKDAKRVDYQGGLVVGQAAAYGAVAAFLKTLTINETEYPEESPPPPPAEAQ